MRPDMNLTPGEFIVMPNHFHAIIIIGENKYNTDKTDSTLSAKNKFGPQSKNLASIVRGFKIGVTTNARKLHADFEWQTHYYDHIIRNEKSFQQISEYIISNPMRWKEDKFYSP
jgi:REP element-mobilizing transposase RayT